jgi:hypothetical protein
MEKDMNMQDKELDAFFRDRLDDLEMEPSGNLWANITAELDAGNKKKKSLVAYLSIAATIVVLLTAGILFMPKIAKVVDEQPDKYNIAKRNKTVKPVVTEKTNRPVAPAPVIANAPVTEHIAVAKAKKVKAVKANKVNIIEVVSAEPEPVIASVSPKAEVLTPVVPDNDVPLNEKTTPAPEPFVTNPVVLATTNQPQTDTPAQPVKKKRINSFGGLLNALVAKIDKRKDKLIEFSDADENSITGVNLGILKIKKEEE